MAWRRIGGKAFSKRMVTLLTHAYIYMHIYTHTHAYIYIYTYIHIYTHIYIYTYTCIHINTYAHICGTQYHCVNTVSYNKYGIMALYSKWQENHFENPWGFVKWKYSNNTIWHIFNSHMTHKILVVYHKKVVILRYSTFFMVFTQNFTRHYRSGTWIISNCVFISTLIMRTWNEWCRYQGESHVDSRNISWDSHHSALRWHNVFRLC